MVWFAVICWFLPSSTVAPAHLNAVGLSCGPSSKATGPDLASLSAPVGSSSPCVVLPPAVAAVPAPVCPLQWCCALQPANAPFQWCCALEPANALSGSTIEATQGPADGCMPLNDCGLPCGGPLPASGTAAPAIPSTSVGRRCSCGHHASLTCAQCAEAHYCSK